MKTPPQKYVSKDEALEKLKHYCAYQERCHQEVRTKLLSLKIYGDDLEDIILSLIEQNYLNEERFARSYARGKFRIKSWGKVKIINGLKAKSISEYCRRKALEEISDDEYLDTLNSLIQSKLNKLDSNDRFVLHKALVKYGVGKGYEYYFVKDRVEEILT